MEFIKKFQEELNKNMQTPDYLYYLCGLYRLLHNKTLLIDKSQIKNEILLQILNGNSLVIIMAELEYGLEVGYKINIPIDDPHKVKPIFEDIKNTKIPPNYYMGSIWRSYFYLAKALELRKLEDVAYYYYLQEADKHGSIWLAKKILYSKARSGEYGKEILKYCTFYGFRDLITDRFKSYYRPTLEELKILVNKYNKKDDYLPWFKIYYKNESPSDSILFLLMDNKLLCVQEYKEYIIELLKEEYMSINVNNLTRNKKIFECINILISDGIITSRYVIDTFPKYLDDKFNKNISIYVKILHLTENIEKQQKEIEELKKYKESYLTIKQLIENDK